MNIQGVIDTFKAQCMVSKTEDDIKREINLFMAKIGEHYQIEIASSNERTSAHGGRADSIYNDVIVELKKLRLFSRKSREGIDEGYIQKNPYKWLNIRRGDEDISIDDYLTFEELRQMANAKMPSVRLERVRDLFIFQCYTCLSYADLFKFDAKRIEVIEGKKTYFDERKKGHGKYGKFVVPMLPKALEILEKYNGQLPIISNTKYNKYIKEVAEETGISQRLHTHLARHTGATMLLNAGVPLNVVSKILGHKNTRITERIYAKLLDKTIVQEVNKVEDKL